MNREEAIESLRGILTEAVEFENSVCYVTEEDREPLEMAIKALEQEPCEDAIGRSDMLDTIGHGTTYTSEDLQKIIKGLPPINPQQWETCFDCPLSHGCPKIKGCTNEQAMEYASKIPNDCPLSAQSERKTDGDTISRQAVLDKKELIELEDGQSFYCISPEDVETLPSVNPQYTEVEGQKSEDAISRQAAIEIARSNIHYGLDKEYEYARELLQKTMAEINSLPPVNPQPKTGHCKDCKFFEYDSVAKVDGIPLIVAHEICSRWGDGCKTREGGYCFLFEPQESEEADADSD